MLSRVATLWSPIGERTNLLALVGDFYCILVTFPMDVILPGLDTPIDLPIIVIRSLPR